MSNRLNYSSIDDAWGDLNNKKFNYRKPTENILTIDSNEVKKDFKPVKETFTEYVKPCSLVDEHIKNCDICKNKLSINVNQKQPKPDNSIIKKLNIQENFNSFDLNENFENISPSQKNLLVIVLYGILVILISDLIIKEKNE
jgi:hypothetical protein